VYSRDVSSILILAQIGLLAISVVCTFRYCVRLYAGDTSVIDSFRSLHFAYIVGLLIWPGYRLWLAMAGHQDFHFFLPSDGAVIVVFCARIVWLEYFRHSKRVRIFFGTNLPEENRNANEEEYAWSSSDLESK